jgi:hypothetical protein
MVSVVRFRNDADDAECAQTFPSLMELTYSIRYASPHCPSLILVRTTDRHLGDKGMSTGWDFEKDGTKLRFGFDLAYGVRCFWT